MRFHYPNLDRPKKAAKRVARLLGDRLPLSKVQNHLAAALGYHDWHELEVAHAAQHPAPLDQDLPSEDFRSRSADLTIKIATALGIMVGEALYVLLASKLTGDVGTAEDQFAIRVRCWKTTGDWPTSGMAGTTVRFHGTFAGPRPLAMLTADFGRGRDSQVQIITDNRFRHHRIAAASRPVALDGHICGQCSDAGSITGRSTATGEIGPTVAASHAGVATLVQTPGTAVPRRAGGSWVRNAIGRRYTVIRIRYIMEYLYL